MVDGDPFLLITWFMLDTAADLHHLLWKIPHGGLDLWDFDQALHGFHHLCALLQGSGYTQDS